MTSFLVARHDASTLICNIQDYTFQFGQMLCTATITAINAYVFFVLYYKTLPKDKQFMIFYVTLMGICAILQGISVIFDIASMFCDDEDQGSTFSAKSFNNGSQTQQIVLKCAYFYPLLLFLFVNVIFCCYCVFQFIYRVNHESRFMLPLLRRLLTFTLIVIASGLPKLISMFIYPDDDLFVNISDCILHLSGVLLSLSYFYYAIVQDKKRWDTSSLLRATLLMSSSIAGDVSLNNSKSSLMMSSVDGTDHRSSSLHL